MKLTDLDDTDPTPVRGVRLTPATFTGAMMVALPAFRVPCGYFVLTLTDGSRRQFRVRLDKGGLFAGKRTLARLTGPDGSDEWENVATVVEDGFAVFKRLQKDWVAKHAAALWKLLHGEESDGYSVACDIRCRWCMRELTDKDAIELQLGRHCGKRLGLIESKPRKKRSKDES